MRIQELEIHNVRGIVYLHLKPDQQNLVIWGPNGSGKSAVVDAIDFLLTGRIARLTGAGTAGMTLNRHGPHIDHRPEEAVVRAVVSIPGIAQAVELKRCVAQPGRLECGETVLDHMQPILTVARRGQHVLTRRDILRYITAEAGTRAQEIQNLLNIAEIEDIRKTLVKVENELTKERKDADRPVHQAEAFVCATVQRRTFNETFVLEVVNKNREILGGQPIAALRSSDLNSNLVPPQSGLGGQHNTVSLVEKDIQNLRDVLLPANGILIGASDQILRQAVAALTGDPNILRELSRLKLTELGLTLLNESGSCPLCDWPWPAGELRQRLDQRVETAQVAVQHRERIESASSLISSHVNRSAASLQKVITTANTMGLTTECSKLDSWLKNLSKLSLALESPVERYSTTSFTSDQVQRLLAPEEVEQVLETIQSAVRKSFPKITPEQTAWDTLTRLDENIKALELAMKRRDEARLFEQRAIALRTAFTNARDRVLGELYDSISQRFTELYRMIHGLDEASFTAAITPDGAGLDFEVDFYGRGVHPPHTLHSEGHQDSMGLCLYLALAERLTAGVIDLIILDDVVMSVDSDHRRQFCHLLATCFPDRQFLVTTHDRTWANQMRSEALVTGKGLVEFFNWHVDSGPQVNFIVDVWKRIEDDLSKQDVSSAAARLRRASEAFFATMCDRLMAQVTYKQNGRYELGDFLPATMKRFGELLRLAKQSADSWDNDEGNDELKEVENVAKAIFSRTNAEQWAVNANVHYNNWANSSVADFQPVVHAFYDLNQLFVCSKCGGLLYLSMSRNVPVSLRCDCGQVSWNLVKKGRNG